MNFHYDRIEMWKQERSLYPGSLWDWGERVITNEASLENNPDENTVMYMVRKWDENDCSFNSMLLLNVWFCAFILRRKRVEKALRMNNKTTFSLKGLYKVNSSSGAILFFNQSPCAVLWWLVVSGSTLLLLLHHMSCIWYGFKVALVSQSLLAL